MLTMNCCSPSWWEGRRLEPPELAGRWGCPKVRITREPLEAQCSI